MQVPDPCRGPLPEGDKSGRGSEAAARALLGRRLVTEVYSKFEYYIGPEGAYGGVPRAARSRRKGQAKGSAAERRPPKPPKTMVFVRDICQTAQKT